MPTSRRPLFPLIALLAGLVVTAAGCATSRAAADIPPVPRLGKSQAVEYDDVGDPSVLAFPRGIPGWPQDHYLAFWTSLGNSNIPVAVSPNLTDWVRTLDALPTLPTWAAAYTPPDPDSATPTSRGTWGPVVSAVGARWVLYFSTRAKPGGQECIGAASGSTPYGPYTTSGTVPMICQPGLGGSIDPSVVHPPGGGLALVWKSDGSRQIWEQALTASGLAVTGGRHLLIGATQAWEDKNVESPEMLSASKGGYWLFYSGSEWYTSRYGTGVAWCRSIQGPCAKPADSQLLTSRPGEFSPGGLDVFRDTSGRLWAVYSTFGTPPRPGPAVFSDNRVMRIAPILSS